MNLMCALTSGNEKPDEAKASNIQHLDYREIREIKVTSLLPLQFFLYLYTFPPSPCFSLANLIFCRNIPSLFLVSSIEGKKNHTHTHISNILEEKYFSLILPHASPLTKNKMFSDLKVCKRKLKKKKKITLSFLHSAADSELLQKDIMVTRKKCACSYRSCYQLLFN